MQTIIDGKPQSNLNNFNTEKGQFKNIRELLDIISKCIQSGSENIIKDLKIQI